MKAIGALKGEYFFGTLDADLFAKLSLEEVSGMANNDPNYGSTRPFHETYRHKNKTCTAAAAGVANFLAGLMSPVVLPSNMELGTGSGTPQFSDTALWSPSVGTLQPVSTYSVYNTYYAQWLCAWPVNSTIGTWTECGLFDANSNLWAHGSMNIQVNTNEILIGQWQIQMVGN